MLSEIICIATICTEAGWIVFDYATVYILVHQNLAPFLYDQTISYTDLRNAAIAPFSV